MCLPSVDQAEKLVSSPSFNVTFVIHFFDARHKNNINQLVPAAILVSICLLVLVFSCFNPMSFSFSSCHLQFIQLPLNKVVGTMKAFPSEGNLPEKDKVCHLALQNTPICADTVHVIVAVSVLDMCPLCLH